MIIFFRTVDPLQIQHVKLISISSGNLFQIPFFKQFFLYRPDIGKIVLIQGHTVVKKGGGIIPSQSAQGSIVFRTLEISDKFFYRRRIGKLFNIQF